MYKRQALDGVTVYHAGTREQDGQILTNGGRVIDVTALGATFEDARNLCLLYTSRATVTVLVGVTAEEAVEEPEAAAEETACLLYTSRCV